jgi:hypothetical protein
MERVSHYDILRVPHHVEFEDLRKAYRQRAMECHPDRFAGDSRKSDEFRAVVAAFNTLSDPVTRHEYDASLGIGSPSAAMPGIAFETGADPEDESAILDTMADDILEELIVGNVVPENTSLQTLMLDLEQTEQFCLFRQAKTYLYRGSTIVAELLFRQYLQMSPINILAHYFLAKCCVNNGDWGAAERALRQAIRLGEIRRPPLRLLRLRRELIVTMKRRPGFFSGLRRPFLPTPPPCVMPASSSLAENRSFTRAINELARRRDRHRLGGG